MKEENFYVVQPLKILYRYRRIILIVGIASSLIAAVFTAPYFTPPIYQAETLIYPPASNSNKVLLSGVSRFGSDKEIDEQIQIIKSNEVRDSIFAKYHLVQHYKINVADKIWKNKLNKEYNNNITIDRTRYSSISVIVLDTDPVIAANMANDIVKFGDLVKNKIIKKSLNTAFEALEKEQLLKIIEIDSLSERLYKLNNLNLEAYIPYQRMTDVEKLKEQLSIRELINKARSENNYSMLELLFGFENKLNQLRDVQENYSRLYFDFANPVPESFIISRAEASDKKISPLRTIIVIATFFGSLLIFWTGLFLLKRIPLLVNELK